MNGLRQAQPERLTEQYCDLSPEDAGPEPKHIRWEHLSGHVRLGGRRGKELWWQLLEVPVFVEAISALLDPSD